MSSGSIPSAYNGTLNWPMSGDVTQPFGCTGFSWEPPFGSCAHFHQGIDIVAPYGTPIHAAGEGTIVYIGWNYADGADPAWIVIIAHSQVLQTWYAHMSPQYPGGIHAGSHVDAGQVIGRSPWLQSVHLESDARPGDIVDVTLVAAGPNSMAGAALQQAAA